MNWIQHRRPNASRISSVRAAVRTVRCLGFAGCLLFGSGAILCLRPTARCGPGTAAPSQDLTVQWPPLDAGQRDFPSGRFGLPMLAAAFHGTDWHYEGTERQHIQKVEPYKRGGAFRLVRTPTVRSAS
nr:hypothetical protein StreXyl84_65500 [Streptomyces sp. Xyl84]